MHNTILLKIKTSFGFHKIVKPKERYDFVENQDFTTVSKNLENGRPRLEYALTLDKTSLLGLRTVLSGTTLWKTKIISRFLKKEASGWWYEFVGNENQDFVWVS